MGDGETYNTAAIQAAIEECAGHPKGGVVTFEGNSRYLSGQIKMKDGVRLRLPKTTTLLAGLKVRCVCSCQLPYSAHVPLKEVIPESQEDDHLYSSPLLNAAVS